MVPFVFVFYRNPPPDHWALVSGLPTYVAQNGLVSNTTSKGERFELGEKVKEFTSENEGNNGKFRSPKVQFFHLLNSLFQGVKRGPLRKYELCMHVCLSY